MQDLMAPLFIVLEGIDGSGKSTQADLLQLYFERRGETAILSPEPTAGPIGKLIRQALQTEILLFLTPQQFEHQMGYLFAADRYYHLHNQDDGVLKALIQDQSHVITPRYYFSSFAYNAHSSEDWDFIHRLNQGFPAPDLLIYLDLSVEEALLRINERKAGQNQECYEKEEKLREVSHNYQKILQDYRGELLTLDANQPISVLHDQIVEYIQKRSKNLL